MKKFITLLLVLTGMVLTASAQLYLAGSFNSWKPSSANAITMTDKGSGIYEYTTSSIEGGQGFVFSEATGSNDDDWDGFNAKRWSPNSNTYIELGKEISLTKNWGNGSAGAYQFGANGTYKIEVNMNTKKFKVTEVTQNNMYMLGDFTGGSWDTKYGVAMTKKSNGVYSATVTTSKADAYIAFGTVQTTNSDDWTTFNTHRFGADATLTIRETSSIYYTSDKSLKISTAKTYTLILDVNMMKAFIDDATKYYMMSYDGSSWTVGDEMTKDGFVYSSEITGANKKFVFVPDVAITGGTTFNNDWTKVIRPYTGNPYYVNFANYDDATITNTDAGDAPLWWINSTNPATCAITFTPYRQNFTINPYVTATLNSNGYGTFGTKAGDYCIPAKDTEDNDVKAYVAKSASSSVVSMEKLDAGKDVDETEGLFLIGTANKTVKFTPASAPVVAAENMLKRGLGENVKTVEGSYYRYVFSGDAFKLLSTTGVTVPVGKAYLEYESATPLANELTFSFDDGETTSIRVINTDDTTTKSNNEAFNVAGQRVANPTKGLYIVNGKKVMVK